MFLKCKEMNKLCLEDEEGLFYIHNKGTYIYGS